MGRLLEEEYINIIKMVFLGNRLPATDRALNNTKNMPGRWTNGHYIVQGGPYIIQKTCLASERMTITLYKEGTEPIRVSARQSAICLSMSWVSLEDIFSKEFHVDDTASGNAQVSQ